MPNAALSPSAGALAQEVCDRLLKKGLLKAKPEFIRKDREAKLVNIFGKANLNSGTLPSIGGRKRLEMHLLSVTAGEACAWIGNVVNELAEIVRDGAVKVGSTVGKGHEGGELQPRALANKTVSTVVEGSRRLEFLRCEDLASRVCDRLTEKGLMKAEKPHERRDCELGISLLLQSAQVDSEALVAFRDRRSLEQRFVGVAGSGAHVHLGSAISDIADVLLEMVSAEQAGVAEDIATEADRSGLVPFETASDDLDNKDLDSSGSTASPPQSQGPLQLEALASRVCTRLVEKGMLKTKPAFVRTDRKASICTLLRQAGLEGAGLTAYSDRRSLELRLQLALKGEACAAWLDSVVAELVVLSQNNDLISFQGDADTNIVKLEPAQKSPIAGKHTSVAAADTPRSMATCSTSDSLQEIPPQKRVSFTAAPAEVLHVVPYSEMYILHPNRFDFDRDGRYVTDDESVDANLRSAVRPMQAYRPPISS